MYIQSRYEETRLGKWKVSQNRTESDRLGVIAGLGSRQDEKAVAMKNLVKQHWTAIPHLKEALRSTAASERSASIHKSH